jgi:hypothetical protein
MIDDIKTMLGDVAGNFTDAQINLCVKRATAEVKAYCNCELDEELNGVVSDIAVIKLYRLSTEGLTSMSASGVAENYIDGYPANIMAVLNRKRKIKVI